MRTSHVLPVSGGAWPLSLASKLQQSVHPSEIGLAALIVANLCFLPWAFGGVDGWSQLTSLFLASAAFIVSLLPRRAITQKQNIDPSRLNAWWRLRSFPVFWAGLVLFAYVGVQLLNPAYTYNQEGINWWLSTVDHVGWAPAGMRVPFDNASPSRWITTAAISWLTVSALWVGVTRRRTVHAILGAIAVNAFVFACFGIVQRASGATEVYGVRPVGYPYFFAAIIYKNHAAAFFGLAASVSFAACAHFARESLRRPNRSGPEVIFILMAAILLLSLILTYSFSGIALYGSALSVAALKVAWRYRKSFPRTPARRWSLIAVTLLLVCSFAIAASTGYRDWQEKSRSFFASEGRDSARMRLLAGRRGWEMFQARWALGWGAGCFQYGFSKYQAREPDLEKHGQVRLRWEHVHDDWLELLIELGVIGTLPIWFIILYWLKEIWDKRLWSISAAVPILGGLVALGAQALIDFPFQNLAVAATAAALLALLVKLRETENRA